MNSQEYPPLPTPLPAMLPNGDRYAYTEAHMREYIDAYRALAAPGAAIDAREQEAEEDAYVIDRLSKILAGVAIALKGEELPRHRHSYHDLEDVARALKLELDLYRATFPDGVPESALASRITSAAPSEALCPATVAQPVAYVNGDELDNMLDDRTAVIQRTRSGFRNTPLYAAQPCASQGCGGAVSEGLTDEQISDAWREMPGGPEGWLKQFGYIQFARAILKHAGIPHHPPRVTVEMFEQLRQTYNLASEVSIRLSDIRAALSTAPRSLDGADSSQVTK